MVWFSGLPSAAGGAVWGWFEQAVGLEHAAEGELAVGLVGVATPFEVVVGGEDVSQMVHSIFDGPQLWIRPLADILTGPF